MYPQPLRTHFITAGRSTPGLRQEFHIRRSIRDALSLETALFAVGGSAVFADLAEARRFAHSYEQHRTASGHPDPSVRAGEIVAMGIMDEVLHHLIAVQRSEQGGDLASRTLEHLRDTVGNAKLEETLQEFCREYPPAAVYRGEQSIGEYLDERVDGLSGRERTVEEMALLAISNENPATGRYRELFDDARLREESAYPAVLAELEQFYRSVPVVEPDGERAESSLLDLLREPFRAHPASLEEQLRYVRERWGPYVGRFLTRVLRSLDVIREEEKVHADPGAGPPPAEVYQYDEGDQERFSPDTEWMPGVVMIAKSTLVWLHQLSERFSRPITRLDDIPDEELDRLARAGFNALWLIGLWERSPASRRIKHLTGNPDAEASAYALYSYDIAAEIGGWQALEQLRRRCSDRGIRLASDMVPNHTGIDSPWLHEHPDWYVHLDHPPFPSYTYSGENLSGRGDVGVYLEDHYFDRTDAAVTFKHVDTTGRERYVYHGNDGTSMPWNDTAQLNYLNPEARETVVQTILHVARNFPVIRFDAAMTLAKRHYRRLWFPEPGSGGDIASRAEHGLTREEFDRAMPQEFWREVVDRVAREAPGTLLLAEAFWMMEGYFVRTLGMHRVYNSAFMNMLKREQNGQYREIIRNTLAFEPEILKRFVNFMNNPDEETAVTQFGTGDKYIGVATLLATMPGLPMFGHGQIEGLAEKYGMEFRRPYWDEQPDEELIARHEKEIFPLLRHRELFASASNFRLYDLRDSHGNVNENVFVYTNRRGDERAIVAFNNSYERAVGTVSASVPYQSEGSETTELIGSALGLPDTDCFLVFQEQRSGLWYLRRTQEVRDRGLAIDLDGYQAVVFWKVHTRVDESGDLSRLLDEIGDGGVPDIDRAIAGLQVAPVRSAYMRLVTHDLLAELGEAMQGFTPLPQPRFDTIRGGYLELLERIRELTGESGRSGNGITSFERHLSTLVSLPHHSGGRNESTRLKSARGHYYTGLRADPTRRWLIAQWTMLVPLADEVGVERLLSWGAEAWCDEGPTRFLRTLLRRLDWAREGRSEAELLHDLLSDSDVLEVIGFNTHGGVEFYHLESLEELLWALFATGVIRVVSTSPLGGRTASRRVTEAFQVIRRLEAANEAAQGRAKLLLAQVTET